jgi:hypothetical protein
MTEFSRRNRFTNALDLDSQLGINIMPHNTQYNEQQEANRRAEELAAQQAADAAEASQGPQAMGLRPQSAGSPVTAGGVAGESLYQPRRRSAARRSITGGY